MPIDQKQLREISNLFNALDAKINAVAAYVAAMPGASQVDKENVLNILRGHRWTPSSPFSTPSGSSMASTVITAIGAAAFAKKEPSDEKPDT